MWAEIPVPISSFPSSAPQFWNGLSHSCSQSPEIQPRSSLQETGMEDWTPASDRNPSVSFLLWHVLQVPPSPFPSVRLNSGRRHCITHSEEQYCTWKIRKERSSAKRKTRKSFRYLPLISELSELTAAHIFRRSNCLWSIWVSWKAEPCAFSSSHHLFPALPLLHLLSFSPQAALLSLL